MLYPLAQNDRLRMHFQNPPLILILYFFLPTSNPLPTPPLCLDAGYYYSSSQSKCADCPKGYYCPEDKSSAYPCPPGQFQPLAQQSMCLDCPANYQCPSSATSVPTACGNGVIAPQGSASCLSAATGSVECNYDTYYLSGTGAGSMCIKRTVGECNLDTHYELSTPFNRTRERTCVPLTPCNTVSKQLPESPVQGVR